MTSTTRPGISSKVLPLIKQADRSITQPGTLIMKYYHAVLLVPLEIGLSYLLGSEQSRVFAVGFTAILVSVLIVFSHFYVFLCAMRSCVMHAQQQQHRRVG